MVPSGGRCGVEALTYPFIKDIAARLNVTLVPLAMDENGVRPDAVQKAHREAHLSALYVQPTIQNPLGMTMPQARRADLLRVVEKLGLPVIEDTVYGFLDEETPMAALAPDSCITLDSLSKKVAPGLALGFIVSPPRLRERIMAAVRSGGWTASGFAFAAGQRLMADGTVAELSRLKRIDAARRQQMAARYLAGFEIQANAKSYHLWLTLPQHWRSQTFVAAAARRDIALTPSTTFAVIPGHAPNAVRLALGAPSTEQLDLALRTLSGMLTAKEDRRYDRVELSAARFAHRPLRDKAPRLVRLDLVPFMEHAAREFGVGVPERPRRPKTVDHDQHFLHFRPVPMQRHRIAARGPGIAEADHAADVGEPERGIDDRQREDHVLAGVYRAILSQDDVGRNPARDHCAGNDLAFRQIRSRRHAAAHDRPAKIPFRHSRQASSTRSSTSSRVPNTNSRSAGRNGVSTRCRALIAAISASVGDRVVEVVTATRLLSGMPHSVPRPAAFREITFRVA